MDKIFKYSKARRKEGYQNFYCVAGEFGKLKTALCANGLTGDVTVNKDQQFVALPTYVARDVAKNLIKDGWSLA
ncbi:hypothetical protein ACI3PL_26600, partial [Lacticaseibacillus paracasei]